MAEPQLDKLIQESISDTVAKPPEANGYHLVQWLTKAGLSMYPWWSPARDIQLRGFWKQSDHLGGAVYTIEAKMSSIPVSVVAQDPTNLSDIAEAEEETYRLLAGAEFGEGWQAFYEKFVEDLVTQDNGAFAEVIGAGRPDGPIIGRPVTIRHLDSGSCQRTGNPIYPVIYHDPGGKMYKLHYSRVIFRSQMSSPIAEMMGVGFSSVSRVIAVTQNLIDILTFKQEKLGSRPYRGVMVTKGGLDPEDIRSAFQVVASEMDSQGMSRYSKIAVVGSSSLPEADLDLKDLAGLPDNFDERTSVELGIAVIALGFGMDARELFPALASGATRADALIQHLKQRGKGPGQIIQMTEQLFNFKYLPRHLQMTFDYQDDEQDRQAAEVKNVRSQRWGTAIRSETLNVRTVREQMVEVGDLERGQFEAIELEDGRLLDGTDVTTLFFTKDPKVKALVDVGVENPLDVQKNDWNAMKSIISDKLAEVSTILVNSGGSSTDHKRARQAYAALKALDRLYTVPANEIDPENKKPGDKMEEQDETVTDPRTRRENPMETPTNRMDDDELEPDEDEEHIKGAGEAADPFDLDVGNVLKTISSYRNNLRSAARGLWNDSLTYFDFMDAMILAINRGFTQAWQEGMIAGNIPVSEMTNEEINRRNSEIAREYSFIGPLATFIMNNSKASGGRLDLIFARIERWVVGYDRILKLAMTYARDNPPLEWQIDAPKESCPSCKRLNGKVKRANYWREHNVVPRSWESLQCKQSCKCSLIPTSKPISRGPLPALP